VDRREGRADGDFEKREVRRFGVVEAILVGIKFTKGTMKGNSRVGRESYAIDPRISGRRSDY